MASFAIKLALLPLVKVPLRQDNDRVSGGPGAVPKEYSSDRAEAADTCFLIIFRPGPNWINGESVFAQALRPHARYMQQLYDQGQLLYAGPFLDDCGGLAILNVSNEAEAREILAIEPATAQQVLIAEIHPWRLLFDAHRGRSLAGRNEADRAAGLES